jgi:hypothetical protein
MSPAGRSVGEGSCLCGAVRFRCGLPPRWVAHCHCTLCRRAQGAGFVTWVGTDGDRFELLGGGDCLRSYRSSPEATRSFCSRCGSPLFFESTRWPGEVHITLASVDPDIAATLQPEGHVHWAQRAPWIGDIHDGLPRHAESGGASS